MVKPVMVHELAARVRAVHRRLQGRATGSGAPGTRGDQPHGAEAAFAHGRSQRRSTCAEAAPNLFDIPAELRSA